MDFSILLLYKTASLIFFLIVVNSTSLLPYIYNAHPIHYDWTVSASVLFELVFCTLKNLLNTIMCPGTYVSQQLNELLS